MKRSVNLPLELTEIPSIAYPTVFLWLSATALWLSCLYAGLILDFPLLLVLPLQTLATYVLFTPMHDAAHCSVSASHRWLNALVGRCCALAFAAPFPAFKFVHLQHHKRTNDPDGDPDIWSEEGPAWQKPLRWASQELYYYHWYFRRASARPLAERLEVYLSLVAIYGVLLRLCFLGHGAQVAWCYLLPIRCAMPVLALLFDWLPHHRWPRMLTNLENRYKATHKLKSLLGFDLSLVTLQQSMHCIHHLWPTIPFYRYHLAWKHAEPELKQAGVETWGIYPQDSKYW